MLKKLFLFLRIISIFSLILSSYLGITNIIPNIPKSAYATTETFDASTTWVAPAGVISVTVDAWGGGGGGKTGAAPTTGGGGGGGGAYSQKDLTVTPGNTYTVTVGTAGAVNGANGGDSWFDSSSTVLAKGGTTGVAITHGNGGLASSGVGTTKNSGGDGGDGAYGGGGGFGGGGGGSAGKGSAGGIGGYATGAPGGSHGVAGTAGTGTPAGAAGGVGGGSGADGSAPGGAGGGGGDGVAWNGAAGRIVLTYTADTTAPTITSISSDKANGTYTTSEVIDIDVTFSEAVTSTGNVTVTLETGTTDQACTFTVTNASTGTCNYTVQAGDNSSDLDASITGTIKDQALNTLTNYTPTTSLATNKALVIDTTAPIISSISSDKANGSYKAGEVIDIDVTFSEAVTSTGNVTVTLETGTIDRTCTFSITNSTTGTCNYTVQAGDTSSDLDATITGTIADQASNAMSNYTPTTTLAVNKALVVDTTAPTISSVSSDKANATYTTGEVIDIDVTFSEAVTSTGNVTVTLETGTTDETCTFTVTNATTGTCNYTVQAGDNTSDLNATISGTIADQASNAMSNYTPTTTLATNKALVIDAVNPTAPGTPSTTTPTNSTSQTWSWTAATDALSGIASYAWRVVTSLGAAVTNGTTTLTTVGTNLAEGIYNFFVKAIDNATNQGSESTSSVTVDTTLPTISSISSDKANATYTTGEVIDIDVTFSEAVTSTGNVTVTLETGTTDETCTFTVTNATTGTCNYTVVSGDTSSDLNATITGTIKDQANNTLTNYTPSTTLAANKALVIDATAPIISNVSSTPGSTSATISWDTNKASSSQVLYGPTSAYGTTTTQTDTSPRVTSHEVSLTGLVSCATYNYQVKSIDSATNTATSSNQTFTTSSCTNSASVVSRAGTLVDRTAGDTVSLTGDTSNISLSVPTSFSSSNATFQIHQLTKSTVTALTGSPSSRGETVGSHIYELKALTNPTTALSSFDQSITITITYTDAEISSLTESSLLIYRWDGTTWNELTGCTVNTFSNTVSCTTTQFSTFGVFGSVKETAKATTPTCSDSKPTSSPYLFQIDATSSSATIYFTPISNTNKYYISYGINDGAQGHGGEITLSSTGVQKYTINELNPSTTYYFKVRGQNGCMPGDWSNTMAGVSTESSYALSSIIKAVAKPLSSEANIDKITTKSSDPQDKAKSYKGKYDVTIQVVEDNKPIADASVELHSDPQYGKTDEKGEVTFKGVKKGEHKLIIAYKSYAAEQKLVVDGKSKKFNVKLNVTFSRESVIPLWAWLLTMGAWIISIAYIVRRKKSKLEFRNPKLETN